MNKNVLNKLSKIESKVELAEVKVDLAFTDDIKKFIQSAVNNKNIYDAESGRAVDAIQKAKVTAINWRDDLSEAGKKIADLQKAAKDLGIDIPQEILNYKDVVSKGVADASNYVKVLNEIQMKVPVN